ncbi:hypothetical protein K443DRAFT_674652 [Laccaria amethystina LaAM-08-1]|uniref:Unplaced genomic scaffold K443scaffold_20, whole genome shotgun sequence n=1 Tax=Laccaria amethystina LaAM-08-1 TaxID=1095629 RepID=A0A0C9Y7A2_9AGAR|nr:hypothetical protein K443DRAFT_674652 [Laccaria amethystina LaAM-08-1]
MSTSSMNMFSGCPLMTRPSTASSDHTGFLPLLLHTTSNALLGAYTGQFFKVA